MSGHEVDRLRRDFLRGHHEVALVLPVGVVDHDDDEAVTDVLDGLLDGGEPLLLRHLVPPMSRSTYLAITSTSMFTGSPCCLVPRFVASSVNGMRATPNRPSCALVTVKLTPSTQIDPFSTTYRATSGETSISMVRPIPSSATVDTIPRQSTWP